MKKLNLARILMFVLVTFSTTHSFAGMPDEGGGHIGNFASTPLAQACEKVSATRAAHPELNLLDATVQICKDHSDPYYYMNAQNAYFSLRQNLTAIDAESTSAELKTEIREEIAQLRNTIFEPSGM